MDTRIAHRHGGTTVFQLPMFLQLMLLRACSMSYNSIDDAGAGHIAQALRHTPALTTLLYVGLSLYTQTPHTPHPTCLRKRQRTDPVVLGTRLSLPHPHPAFEMCAG